ncbi:hypothetical protein B5G11_15260 [Drancourtella sp. An57]|nr:hypothetical protein B5G11_15260 [Drancourtella sp. An57]
MCKIFFFYFTLNRRKAGNLWDFYCEKFLFFSAGTNNRSGQPFGQYFFITLLYFFHLFAQNYGKNSNKIV